MLKRDINISISLFRSEQVAATFGSFFALSFLSCLRTVIGPCLSNPYVLCSFLSGSYGALSCATVISRQPLIDHGIISIFLILNVSLCGLLRYPLIIPVSICNLFSLFIILRDLMVSHGVLIR